MAGYPGTPLPKKLGIKAGHKVCLLNAPGTVQRSLASDEVRITNDLRLPPVDVVVLFVDTLEQLEDRVTEIVGRLHPAGGFWVAWRRTSRRVSEDMVRRIAMAAGMTTNKMCDLNGSYAGVRMVLRGEIREAMAYRAEPPPRSMLAARRARPAARTATRTTATSGAGSSMRRARARAAK